MRSFDVCLFVGVCVCVFVCAQRRSWKLNANKSKKVKATDLKFDKSVSRDSLDTTPKTFSKKGRGQGHVTH